jgi:hypothetical protein
MDSPRWARRHVVNPDHVCDFSIEQPLDLKVRPRYVKTEVIDRYCSICGSKQTLLERLAEEAKTAD